MLNIANLLKDWLVGSQPTAGLSFPDDLRQGRTALQPIGFGDFLNLNVPPREMLLDPILPERSLAMLYAPRGVGKTLLGLSIGLAVASGTPLLRWAAPRKRRVLYVDGEMPLVSLQERLRMLSVGFGSEIPNDGFQVLAADHTESGISLGAEEGQNLLDPLLGRVDLLILDNLSTLCTTGSESASDAWVPMQNWMLKLWRQGVAVLMIHHAGTNGRQRGTSRREDALDTVIALRRPEDASADKTARIWDAATAQEIAVLRGRESDVNSVSFSPDGSRRMDSPEGEKYLEIYDALSKLLEDVHLDARERKVI
jgi:RecA-family ATPase